MLSKKLSAATRIGDLLIEYGYITKQQLDYALGVQKTEGGKIGDVLIDLGYIASDSINEVLEYQLGVPYVDLDEYNIELEAIKLVPEQMVKKHRLIPIGFKEGALVLAMENPLDIFAIDDVQLVTGKMVVPMFAAANQIMKGLDIYYGKQQVMQAVEAYQQERLLDVSDDVAEEDEEEAGSAPIVKMVNTILEQGVRFKASDIHIEGFEKNIRVRFRIDGRLKEMYTYDIALLQAVVARIKILGGMDISEKRRPQDGRVGIKVDKREYDIRISSLPTVFGEKIVMRINSKQGFTQGKEDLGFSTRDMEKFDNILRKTHGIILITGPTGSGKSTTLYTALKELNKEDINIVTVEDPVESQIYGINQVQVNPKAGTGFSEALRSILRQDPDIIMIGEIRDQETAEIAVKASVTGHLVVSTLHTNDAPSTITRLVDMGLEPYLISASLEGIIAQRLMRKLCPKCKEKYTIDSYEQQMTGIAPGTEIYRAVGCRLCNQVGYQGRIGIYEVLEISKGVKHLISQEKTEDEVREQGMAEGMKTLRQNGIALVEQGITSIEELMKVTYGKE